MKQGLIHLYYGDGKGKTTAAVGLTVRAAGREMRVLFAQFLKHGKSGELRILEQLKQVSILRCEGVRKFTFQMDASELQQTRDVQNRMLQEIIYRVGQGRGYDLLILDEAINAVSTGTLDEALLRAFVEQKPEPLELVLTGRNPPGWLIGRADYLSEICSRKQLPTHSPVQGECLVRAESWRSSPCSAVQSQKAAYISVRFS